jgi:xylulokinase
VQAALERYREGLDTLAEYSESRGYGLRFALEPKPNEPRGDIFLPTVGHAIAFIAKLDHAELFGVNPEVGHEQMSNLNFTHAIAQALWQGKLFHIDLNGQHGPKFDQDLIFGHGDVLDAFALVDLLEHGGPAAVRRTTGPRHFDYKPLRTEDATASGRRRGEHADLPAAQGAAAGLPRRPEVQEALAASGAPELTVPTRGEGESLEDLLADRSAFEDFDADRRPSAATATSACRSWRSSTCSARAERGARRGVDSSTQACKVVVRDADTGGSSARGARRTRRAPRSTPRPGGRRCSPRSSRPAASTTSRRCRWAGSSTAWSASTRTAGSCARRCCGTTPARRARRPTSIAELGDGDARAAGRPGPTPSGSSRSRRSPSPSSGGSPRHEPEHAARVAAVCLPHDWLTWRLAGTGRLEDLVTDRGDASGTGYWSPASGAYRTDLLERAFGRPLVVPRVLGPAEQAGRTPGGTVLGPGTGDNAAAALGVGAEVGDVVLSLGTSGVVSTVSTTPAADPSGIVAGFADATGGYLPLVVTLNAARVLDAVARLLGVDHDRLSSLALDAPAGSGGLVLVPYLEGERTPDRPDATGALHGLTLTTSEPACLARARSRGCCAGSPTGWTRSAPPAARRAASCWWVARRGRRPSVAWRPPSWASPSWCRRPASPSRTAPPGRLRGCWPGGALLRVAGERDAGVRRSRDPGVRERYAEARDLTVRQLPAD